ncbi:latrophilin Cirl-like isoform X9 [Palaemon carinicauda]|uniref:latrophilin Cirl-like isoform X9 n=1 Tax=Palaemon carinicauda TaxID=392227 RepID=UPI0035B5ACFF
MECDPGHVINLIRANYGRFSITICNEHGNTEWSVNCMSPRSHRVLHDKCSQRQNCSVPASTRGFGDPCPGTLKYLEAHFQCVDVNPPSHTARPRPPWFIATKTTVSSITEDDPPLPSPPAKGGSVPVGGSGGGIGGPFGVGEGRLGGDGIGDSGEVVTRGGEGGSPGISQEGLPFENRLKEAPAEDLPHSVTASASTTTTLRPPPWLITNTTKNTTLSTTTTSTTSTTTSTVKPPSTSTTTTSKPQTNLDSPVDPAGSEENDSANNQVYGEGGAEDEDDDDASPTELYDAVESDRLPSSPVSTTTPWPVRAEVPVTEGSLGSEASWCPPSSDRSLVWNWTKGGDVAVQSCPGGASGWARRSCNPLGWSGPADLSECRSVWLTTLTSRAHASDAVLAVAHDLAIVTGSRALYGGDVTATANLINSLARRMAEDVSNFPDRAQREAMVTELVGAVVATGSHLVGRQRAAWGDLRPPEHQVAATALLLGLEEAAFLLADNLHQEKTVIHAESNILLRLQVLETRNVVTVTFPSPGEAWLPSTLTRPSDPSSSPTAPLATTSSYLDTVPSAPMADFPQDVGSATPKVPLDSIRLPPEAMLENADNGLVKIVFFSFDGLHHMLQPNAGIHHFNAKNGNKTRVLNSRVLSASLGAGRHIELSEPVVLTFAMIRTVNVTNPACVFWDYTTSSWSEEGCDVLLYNTSHTVCQCDHLTNFAVLMDLHATPLPYPHRLALSIITYVGCIISIVCLLLATIVFHAFRGLKSDRTTIHKNLCVCLLVAETVFLAGVNQTDKPEVCGVVAGLLHFFLLAAFCWMFMEGFQLYAMLVEVFESEKPRARWYYAASYGFPAIVVAVSAVADPFGYKNDYACWLQTKNYFIFAFVGPVIAIIIANCIFLGMAMFIMCRTANISASLKNKEHTKLASVNSGNEESALLAKVQKHAIWVRGAMMLVVLLGLTWTFGLLYLNNATVLMDYIFTVLNSLQGLFIFIFHCVQNEKVKKELRRAGRRHPWLRACLCAAHDRSHTTTKDARTTSHNAASHSHSNSHASHTTVGTSSHHPHIDPGSPHSPSHIQLPSNLNSFPAHHLPHSHTTTTIVDENGCPVGALNAAFNLPSLPNAASTSESTSSSSTYPPDYQNSLPFHIQQMNAAQIYSSPPPTPNLSQLYEMADPVLAADHQQQQQLHHYIQPRSNPLPLSPHQGAHHQTISTLSISPTMLQAALSSLQHSKNPKSLATLDHHHYHNLLQLPLSAVHLTHDDSNYLQPKSHITSNTLTNTHLPSTPVTIHLDKRSSQNDHSPQIHPTTTSISTTTTSITATTSPEAPVTPKTAKVPPRKPERPQKNNNNKFKEILLQI